MQIADRTVASFHYTLTNEGGDVIDTSREREPLAYLHGAGNIVPGLEKAMAGRTEGDTFKVEVTPDEGYGPRHDELVQTLPKSSFQGAPEPKPGMQFQGQGPQGPVMVVVTEVEGDQVTIDGNHPLAGKTLNFDIEVTEVRSANEEELTHGHVHGAGGEHE
ncbi:peptidylprolyl isomerase [Oleiagrimonas sp.]|jgi:FKBP-type peptidyl-prolyl cis-trans isomerase SlyD|uniref:FKBP-type peptidyl-prolyl cis-trans isomerase n=1 Tax=Oleiagrimonas sp. TaxID=2010330 RepID=UPI002610304A|nr:peptidylprolyl isomerase [Oleiagrimonas sp.]MDA3915330.1 peptidylprolyl isomerase [Oleiagrimonas sp.]